MHTKTRLTWTPSKDLVRQKYVQWFQSVKSMAQIIEMCSFAAILECYDKIDDKT